MIRKAILLFCLPFLLALSCSKEAEKSSAISAIPVRSAFVVRVNSLQDLAEDLNTSIPGAALKESLIFAHINDFVALLKPFQGDNNLAIKGFGGFDQYGAGRFEWIWSIEIDNIPFITKAAMQAHGEVNSRIYGSSEIVHFTNDDLDFYFAEQNGLLLLSKEENLVEASLKQLESGINLENDARFIECLKSTSSKDPVNVFIQYKSLPDWLASVLNNQPEWPANLATWSAFDLDLNENDINFTGISLVPDSTQSYFGLFKKTGNGSSSFAEVVPENTAMAISQNCGNMAVWHTNFEHYLGTRNKLKSHQSQLKDLNIIAADWIAFTDEEIGVFYSEGARSVVESKNGFIRLEDAEMATQTLRNASGDFTESYRDIDINKLNKRYALPLVYGKLFSHLSEPYWFVHGKWAVFCNDLSIAKNTINNLLAEKTWSNFSDFERVNSLYDSDANICMIAHNPEWLNLAQKELEDELAKKVSKSKEAINSINWAMVQIHQKGDAAYTEIMLLHQEKTQGSAKQHWGVNLEGVAAMHPQLVKNHYTNTNEVVVQDKANNLYLISASGEVLWKKLLDGPILGEIEQIDMFKNNKLQLVFNTQKLLYILDRNGKDVDAFPIKLPNEATAAMSAIDYDNNRNYRILVPCGKHLYNFEIDGKLVNGWDFKKAKANLVAQPKHATIGTKDFIYTLDELGNVYILNRRGEIREAIKNKLSNLASGIYLVGDKVEGGKLSALGKSGYAISLLLKDQKDSLQAFSEKPRFMHVNGKIQLFAARNELYVRSDAFSFDAEFDEEIIAEPRLYKVGSTFYFAVSTKENQIWILNSSGKTLPGMPLYGSGIAAVGKTNGKEIHVVVASEDGSLLDYKLVE